MEQALSVNEACQTTQPLSAFIQIYPTPVGLPLSDFVHKWMSDEKNNSAQPTHRCLVRKRKGPFPCKHSYIRWGHRQPARADFFTLFSSQPFYDEVSRRAIFSFFCVCRRFAISFWENCKGLAVRSTGRRTGARPCRPACGLASGFRPPLPSASTPSASGFRPLPSASPPSASGFPPPAVRLHTLCGRLPSPLPSASPPSASGPREDHGQRQSA